MSKIDLHHGDCLYKLKTMKANSVDSIVTDPPYGIKFMNKKWDYGIPTVEIWRECLRVLKPGGHLLSFAGTRTQHRMACNIEDAGFEIRDMLAWVYGSGFPKSQNISKAMDKSFGLEREVVGKRQHPTLKDKSKIDRQGNTQFNADNNLKDEWDITAPASEEAKYWEGWGTSLKPALEPITLARKPLSEKTIVKNILEHGTGGINIDESRVPFAENDDSRIGKDYKHNAKAGLENGSEKDNQSGEKQTLHDNKGRFPANFIHDGSEEVTCNFPESESKKGKQRKAKVGNEIPLLNSKEVQVNCEYNDKGNASRFFYCAKPSKKEKNSYLEEGSKNSHVTVKPIKLMKYLIKLITPVKGTVLDPFMGSGTTGISAVEEGFDFIGCEMEEESFLTSKERVTNVSKERLLNE